MSERLSDESEQRHLTIVGVDGSGASEQALRWACEHSSAGGRRSELLVVCVRTIAPLPEDLSMGAWRNSDSEDPVRGMLEQMADKTRGEFPSVRIQSQTLHGSPADELIRLSTDADLVVVGARGYGAIAGLLLGSVSRRLVNHSYCSVAVVR